MQEIAHRHSGRYRDRHMIMRKRIFMTRRLISKSGQPVAAAWRPADGGHSKDTDQSIFTERSVFTFST
jgi:hypothetical protein